MFETLPLISSRVDLRDVVSGLLGSAPGVELVTVGGEAEAREFLMLEMPPVYLLDLSDPSLDAFHLIESIMADPWLLQGGMIALHEDMAAAQRLTEIQGSNLIMTLAIKDLNRYLMKVLRIIAGNQQLTVQRGLSADLVGNVSARFEIGNDIIEAGCYVNLICNFLFNCGRIDLPQKRQMHMVLMETLMNAIEHGNCGIDFKQKSDWLESGRPLHELVEEYAQRPENREKHVSFNYDLHADSAAFQVADDGPGFDWAQTLQNEEPIDPLALHGRGILMCRQVVQKLAYNDLGNEVTFEFKFANTGLPAAPRLFENRESRYFKAGEFVMHEGDTSTHLYYIARGRFQIRAGGKTVSTMTPNDIFVGEMSFLLGNKRHADVIAETDGCLIPISRKDFVSAIHRYPHYGVFLARLLAQRLVQRNHNPYAEGLEGS